MKYDASKHPLPSRQCWPLVHLPQILLLPDTSLCVGYVQKSVSPFPTPLSYPLDPGGPYWTGPSLCLGSALASLSPPIAWDLYSVHLEDLDWHNWPLKYSHFPIQGAHLPPPSYWGMPTGSAMSPTCLASAETWVLLLGSWKTASPWASTFAMDPYTALVAMASPVGASGHVCHSPGSKLYLPSILPHLW